MPSNTKGGKGYKKKKKQANVYEPVYVERQMGQMVARAIRLLGNRNVLCYSNDNILRMCHICGKMKGRVFIEPGDVILISLRDFNMGATAAELKLVKTGDIIAKYPPEQYKSLKEEGVNLKLFTKLEVGGHCVAEIGTDYTDVAMAAVEDDGFDFEHSGDDDEDEESPKEKVDKVVAGDKSLRGSRQMAATRGEDTDIDIDDI
jgi:translation initiation factor 1A